MKILMAAAVTIDAATLREMHRIHRQLTDLRERLERGPKQIKIRQAAVVQTEEKLAKAQGDYKAARVAIDQKNLQLKTMEARILDLKAKLNACTTNREYKALGDQIQADDMATKVLEDEILEALERVEGLKKLIGDAEEIVAKAKAELVKTQTGVKDQEQSLVTDLNRLEGQLREVEAGQPDDFRPVYQRMVKAKGEDALAQVEGEFCGGCNQQITANMMSDLRLSHVVYCKTCGRILYLPEDRMPIRKA